MRWVIARAASRAKATIIVGVAARALSMRRTPRSRPAAARGDSTSRGDGVPLVISGGRSAAASPEDATTRHSPFAWTSTAARKHAEAQFALRNYLASSPLVDATIRASNAQLPAILAMAKAYGVTSLDKVNGAGTMNLNLHARGPLKSVNTAEIMRTLNGTMKVDFNNVKYSGADINHELASIAGFLNSNPASSPAQGYTNILKMTGDIIVKNGIAETNNLQAKLDLGNVGAAGTASLIDNTLNMRVTVVLSQASSQKAGGNSIGGFMQTALANNKGELVVPALVTGTFSNPKFAPDVQQIAQMKVKGLVPNFDNPASVTGALQNLLGGAKNPAQATPSPGQQQPPQQNPVEQLMGIFGKKKPVSPASTTELAPYR